MYRVSLFFASLASVFLLSMPAAQALSGDPDTQLRTFAACVGRLSAMVEHEWNVSGAVSETTRAQHDAVVEIVAAILPIGRNRDVLHWRNAAKKAQTNLLIRADTATDQAEVRWASRQADQLKQECTALLTL